MDEKKESSSIKNDSDFGRKLFFINPSKNIQTAIVTPLKNEEYEAYIIDDYKDAINILCLNPNSICYIQIDSQLSKLGWYNFIHQLQQTHTLTNLYIGIITEEIDQQTKEQYLENLNITAGLIILDESLDIILSELKDLLESIKAKGRRQYVRAKIKDDKDSYLLWTFNNKMLKFNIRDISSVGIAIDIPSNQYKLFVTNTVIRGLTIKLGLKQFEVSSLIYAVKQADNNYVGILLIKTEQNETKNYIRSYVSQILQNRMYSLIRDLPQDQTDYETL